MKGNGLIVSVLGLEFNISNSLEIFTEVTLSMESLMDLEFTSSVMEVCIMVNF